MALRIVDIPTPARMQGRWAALAAVAAVTLPGACHADGNRWHYDDSGGNWADLHLVDGELRGRAVLLGEDHEYSTTYYGVNDPDETDILVGAPAWWAEPAQAWFAREVWLGFIYGFYGATWHRGDYDEYDGFDSIGLPALSDGRTAERVAGLVEAVLKRPDPPPAAVAALVAAGTAVTADQLRAVVGPDVDVAKGVAAAAAFRAAR